MDDPGGGRVPVRKWLIAVAATPVAVWWLERLFAVRCEGWFAGSTTHPVGSDFQTLHTAARLVTSGDGALLYQDVAFQAAGGPGRAFFYPPPFALVLSPLGWLSFEAAWFAWSVLSVAMVALGLKLLGVRGPVRLALAALLFTPMYLAITFGQTSCLWLLVFAGVYRFTKENRPIAAGVLAGLLILKPTLAIGVFVWWIVEWRRHRTSALAAAASALGVIALSQLFLPGSFSGYVQFTWNYLVGGEPGAQWAQYSMWTFWDLLIPGSNWLSKIAGVASVALLIGAFARCAKARPGLDLTFAAVIAMTILVAPYMLAYDWTLLLIPAVLLWQSGRVAPADVLVGGAVVAIGSTWSIVIAIELLDSPGYTLQFAPLILIGAAVWMSRRLGRLSGPKVNTASPPIDRIPCSTRDSDGRAGRI
jgi:alpha-1,2-mannosyltransferase